MNFANTTDKKSLQKTYRFFEREGVPFEGDELPVLSEDEYLLKTTRVGKSGYGTFDTSLPEEKHFDRTYQEVLDRASTGEFTVIHTDTKWVDGQDNGPPKMFVFISWYELRDMTHEQARRLAEDRPAYENAGSRI